MSLPTDDKARKALPILKFLTEYFPDAILELVRVSVAGNIQHNPELDPADIKWDRTKSTNQLDTAFRHLWDHKTGTVRDKDGAYHLAKTAWRTLAELQLQIERDREKQPGEERVYCPHGFNAWCKDCGDIKQPEMPDQLNWRETERVHRMTVSGAGVVPTVCVDDGGQFQTWPFK